MCRSQLNGTKGWIFKVMLMYSTYYDGWWLANTIASKRTWKLLWSLRWHDVLYREWISQVECSSSNPALSLNYQSKSALLYCPESFDSGLQRGMHLCRFTGLYKWFPCQVFMVWCLQKLRVSQTKGCCCTHLLFLLSTCNLEWPPFDGHRVPISAHLGCHQSWVPPVAAILIQGTWLLKAAAQSCKEVFLLHNGDRFS